MKKRMTFIVVMLLAVLFLWKENREQDRIQQNIAGKVIRFHVMANSDSTGDQAIKLKVRDAVGQYLEPILQKAKSREESEQLIMDNRDAVIAIAENVIEEEGECYGAAAELVVTEFPDKTYGDYTFPKGEYEALQIRLGEAEGHNWWCVLYPNMCFRGSVYEVVNQEAREELREVLSTEELRAVMNPGKLTIRWKVLEYFGIRS